MTALKEYEKLETTALWRETLATQRREVFLSFGNTSLMIRDQNDAALSHWSLPAVHRLNPGQRPALFSPNAEGTETLEIADETMIDAIEKVRAAINRRRPHPGRLRLWVILAFAVTIIALAIFWLPNALVRHTVGVVPPAKRAQIGKALLGHITPLAGKACDTPLGTSALIALQSRMSPDGSHTLKILREGVTKSAHLPGGLILLNKSLVEDHESPEIAAGYAVLESTRAGVLDPLTAFLNFAGLNETFRLLTTGDISDEVLRTYAEHLLITPPMEPPVAALLDRFAALSFSSSPLAYEIDPSGESTLTLIEADPYRGLTYEPLLTDSKWVSLQGICGG